MCYSKFEFRSVVCILLLYRRIHTLKRSNGPCVTKHACFNRYHHLRGQIQSTLHKTNFAVQKSMDFSAHKTIDMHANKLANKTELSIRQKSFKWSILHFVINPMHFLLVNAYCFELCLNLKIKYAAEKRVCKRISLKCSANRTYKLR